MNAWQVFPLAQAIAETAATTSWRYRIGRFAEFSDSWRWLAFATIATLLVVLALRWYRRDTAELPRPTSWFLQLARLTAIGCLVVWFLQLDRRSEQTAVRPSRVVVMADTSQSMSIRDVPLNGTGGPEAKGAVISRAEAMIDALAKGPLVAELRKKHDVDVYRFDQEDRPIATVSLPRQGGVRTANPGATNTSPLANLDRRIMAIAAAAILAAGVLMFVVALLGVVGQAFSSTAQDDAFSVAGAVRRTAKFRDGLLLASGWVSLLGALALAFCHLTSDDLRLTKLFGLPTTDEVVSPSETPSTSPAPANETIDWSDRLAARGSSTRLGSSLRAAIASERGGPAAGVIVLTDGNSNAGGELKTAALAAAEARIPVFPVGIGSDRQPFNLRVVDIEAPRRVYPGDKFVIVAHVQATGAETTEVSVELVSKPAGAAGENAAEAPHDARPVRLTGQGEIVAVRFEIAPGKDFVGTHEFKARVAVRDTESDATDNARSAKVEIVDRKNRVLIVAGGPTREFIFLRNQLFRDKDTHLAVWLQTAKPGHSQEAHEILDAFPKSDEELFRYDTIVAFDPDWARLDDLQVASLERWVGEQGGGLIAIAGPVFTPQWSGKRDGGRIRTIQTLYPVAFYSSGAVGLGRFGSPAPSAIEFTRESASAEFLWLGGDSAASNRAWQSLEGFYGYYAVKDPKPGATVYARFADAEARVDGEFPIYMAGQFFGSGRVFYMGSGEMWRARSVEEAYFEEFYTKLIRWVSEGRLARDASRGVLLVDKQRCTIGERVAVRATLQDEQLRPLTVPKVDAFVLRPDGQRVGLQLAKVKDGDREGVYAEQVTATIEGDWRVELPIPGANVDALLSAEFRARPSNNETERSQRNDAALSELARQTEGSYYVGTESLATPATAGGLGPIWDKLEPRDEKTVVSGASDKRFQKTLMIWLLAVFTTALAWEWLIRRLHRLA